ncbi:MAG: hypothetical protein Unbinned4162contig1001_62 [Prokaryotic dsDNA virus sp.]|nr:MAG: hypothetical protein Unbinned4162contig1001_62 [Prokaryotic dsDNA virus sp.]|tara:strand:- start:46118 stop:46516 length:399 start_codon:yes stop_codon:yes gene_type:complete
MSFGAQLKKFKVNTMGRYVKVKRQSAFDLFSAIIIETPVDKGVLRNNWNVSFKTPDNSTTDQADKSNEPIDRVERQLEGVDVINDIFFSNNLPYIIPIEYEGLSGKAKQGVVRVNTVRWPNIVLNNVRNFNT